MGGTTHQHKRKNWLAIIHYQPIAVPRKGLEPSHLAAHAPETCASTNSATWACIGDPGGTRTHDPLIKSQLLYQLSYGVKRAVPCLICGCKITANFWTGQIFSQKKSQKLAFFALRARTFYYRTLSHHVCTTPPKNSRSNCCWNGCGWYLRGSNQGHADFQSTALPLS